MLRILILVLALGAGTVAAWLVLTMETTNVTQAVAAPVQRAPTIEVLVAAIDLPQGQSLTGENLRWQAWPESAVNPLFISRTARPDAVEKLGGSVVRNQFVTGEPIREEKLARISAGMLAAMLPAGMRAVAIRISAENTAGGFILPNDRVDVIQTMSRSTSNPNDTQSRTILSNIRVLAVDQKSDDMKGQAVVGKTATLELSPEQAEVVTTGQVTGVLSLSLRSVADSDEEPVARSERTNTVRVFRAGRSEVIKIQ